MTKMSYIFGSITEIYIELYVGVLLRGYKLHKGREAQEYLIVYKLLAKEFQ